MGWVGCCALGMAPSGNSVHNHKEGPFSTGKALGEKGLNRYCVRYSAALPSNASTTFLAAMMPSVAALMMPPA